MHSAELAKAFTPCVMAACIMHAIGTGASSFIAGHRQSESTNHFFPAPYFETAAASAFISLRRDGDGWPHPLISASCCWARCACRMSRTVFLSAQPCFHGLHKPHADALRALIRRCVRLVSAGSQFCRRRIWNRENVLVFQPDSAV